MFESIYLTKKHRETFNVVVKKNYYILLMKRGTKPNISLTVSLEVTWLKNRCDLRDLTMKI